MTKIMFVLLAALALVMVLGVLAYQYGGILGLIIAIVTLFFALKFVPKLLGWWFMRSMTKALDLQGDALRGATIEVHEVTTAPKPEPHEYDDDNIFDDGYDGLEHDEFNDEEDDESLPHAPDLADIFYHGPRDWYYLDMSIYPAMRSDGRPTEYQPWHPSMISLLGPERPAPKGLPMGMGAMKMIDGFGTTVGIRVWNEDGWQENDHEEEFGPQRIRLHVGVKPGERQFRVGYVNEVIGQLTISIQD